MTTAAADGDEAGGEAVDEGKADGGRTWDVNEGPALYAPATFEELMDDVCGAVDRCVAAGEKRIEVDFPPLPSSINSYAGASDDFIDANFQLALQLARNLVASGRRPRIVVPDKIELARVLQRYEKSLELSEGVSVGSLEEGSDARGITNLSPVQIARRAADAWRNVEVALQDLPSNAELVAQARAADVHLVLNISTVDLPAVRTYTETFEPQSENCATVLFNTELETLRGDLGQVTFPPKAMHYEFLSTFLPAYFLRRRDYSKTVSVQPFIINYSGALLRIYPAPWQCMLQQDDKSYACVAEAEDRYTLQQFKEELLIALGLDEEEGSFLEVARRGFFKGTWWEVDTEEEVSSKWRR